VKRQVSRRLTIAVLTAALGSVAAADSKRSPALAAASGESASPPAAAPSQAVTDSAATEPSFQVASTTLRGRASWYGPKFHGQRTASGEVFNQWAKTAAHKSLPLGTRVRVTNLRNGESIVVRINDRGPYVAGRIIDLSRGAARAIGMGGTAPVRVQVLGR